MRLVVTTTAMPRPDLLEQTYASFFTNLQGLDWNNCHLRINVDPIGDTNAVLATLKVATRFFSHVTAFCPASASFPLALKRVWADLEGDWVLHLEDDWTLDETLTIADLLRFAEQRPWASQFALRPWRGVNHHQLVLCPSLIRAPFAMKAAGTLTGARNPEQELRSLQEYRRCTAWYPFEDEALITDTGIEWRSSHGFGRDGDCEFLTWKKE